MNWIIDHVPAWNSWMALLLYWTPLMVCAVGYAQRTVRRVRRDRASRLQNEVAYYPTVTLGTLVGYTALAVCPVANLFVAVFDLAPKLLGGFINWCERVLDIPLVPKK